MAVARTLDGGKKVLGGLVPGVVIVDLMSDAGKNSDIALVWAPPAGALSGIEKFERDHSAGAGC